MEWSGAPYGRVGQVTDDSRELHEELQRAVFPRYQVGEEIGRGGMSLVFRVWDTVELRDVAIKVLKHQYSTVLGPTRVLREIRLQTQLQHPGILPLLDSGRSDSLLYYTMPLVEGETLQARLTREPQLPLDTVRQILSQVAAALDYAHDMGVVHRDIKPSNLFVSGDRTLLADFGIAKDLTPSEQDSTTSTGLVLGTALYMSPEQADGNHHADRRADVYSLGCVAYQMIAGEPPFTGPTTQAVIARHRTMPAPSVRVVRPELPRGVDPVLRKALAKSPADRYQRAGEFASSLSEPDKLAAAAREAEAEEAPVRWPWRQWVLPIITLLIAAAVALIFLGRGRPLDANKVVVFPLGETPPEASREGTGVVVALMIGTALEYTQPLEWIDGLPRLDARLRRDPGLLTASEARGIARSAGARWYLDGTVVRRGDSVTVVTRLNDVSGDSVVGRASASRVAVEAAQAGLEAVNHLLPQLLAPGQRASELSALADRRPAAVATWLQGEREYRSFNFARALEFYQRAVKQDSALAIAAVRGAQAANWRNDMVEANALADAAVRHVSLLPGRQAPFALGLHAYLNGRADSAVVWLTRALQASPRWTEARMSLGEVYYHLIPSVDGALDSLAEAEFTAAAVDSGFSPARFHLAELAIRSGDTTHAMRAVTEFLRLAQDNASADQRIELRLMLACARGGRSAVEWQAFAYAPLNILSAAKLLAGGGAYPGCAEEGFRVVFDDSSASLGDRWGGFLGLQGILAAEGRTSELGAVIDSAVAHGLSLATYLYMLDALGGVEVSANAAPLAARTRTDPTAPPYALWLAGEWHARSGDLVSTKSIRDSLAARAARDRGAGIERYAEVLAARVALLEGDTTAAIDQLRTVLQSAPQADLDWGIGASLAPDRLLLAQLLLASGKPRQAVWVAGVFDHAVPAVFLPFLPASLELRRQAAESLGETREAREYADRLAALGSLNPSPTSEAP